MEHKKNTCDGNDLVLLAALLAVQLDSILTVDEMNSMITFLAALGNNLTLMVSCRDPEDIVGPI